MALASTALTRIMSDPGGDEAVDLRELLVQVVVGRQRRRPWHSGCTAWPCASAPLASETKKGLPSEPSVMPTFLNSCAGPAPPWGEGSGDRGEANNTCAWKSLLVAVKSFAWNTRTGSAVAGLPPQGVGVATRSARSWGRFMSCGILAAIAVQCDGADDHQALDDVLPDVRDTHQDQAVGEHRDDQRADQRAEDRAGAADEAGAAENHRRDGIEFVGGAELQAVGRVEPADAMTPPSPESSPDVQ